MSNFGVHLLGDLVKTVEALSLEGQGRVIEAKEHMAATDEPEATKTKAAVRPGETLLDVFNRAMGTQTKDVK